MLKQFLATLHTDSKKYCLISGMLSGLAFAPIFLFPTLFALSIICFQVKYAKNLKDAFISAFLFGFGHFVIGIYWISIGVSVYIDEFWWAIPFALFGIPIILALFIAISCSLSWFARNNTYYHFIFCISFILSEWSRSWMFTGFPWNLLGYSLAFSDTLIQIASVIGIYGLGFLVIYVFSIFHYAFTKQYKELLISLFVSSLIIIVLIIYGYVKLTRNPTTYTDINVRLVQPSIPQTNKWDINEFWQNLDNHINLSLSNYASQKNHADIIIWSEAALTAPYKYPQIQQKLMKDLLSKSNAILITGGISDSGQDDENAKIYTSLYSIDHDGKVLFEYYKSHLVPFGEYMPLKNILPFKKLTHGFLDYTPGKMQIVYLKKYNLLIKPLICYESIFPAEVRTLNSSADVFINVTNDTWYGNSSGPYQHFVQSRMRSIENGIPMLRVANNGISAVIDSSGRVIKHLDINKIGVIDNLLPNKLDTITIYSKFGELMAIACIILVFVIQYIVTKLFMKAR